MVQKITLFELHFDGASFGNTTAESESTSDETMAEEALTGDEDASETGGSRGRKVLGLVVASVVVSVVVSTIARRIAGEDEEFEAIEFESESESEEPIDVVEE
jgi:hypothetical protein